MMADKEIPSSTLLSLAGYLDLHLKSWRGKQKRRYWFWFDEQTCHLKYYRNQEAYQQGVFEPLMTIDLRCATITPPMAAEELAANQFQISAGGQSYTLAAADTEKAHSWIRKLQEKREQWIHRDAAQGKTDLDRQARRKILQPLHERPGVLLPDAENVDSSKEEPSTVRKIVSRHVRLATCHSSPLDTPTYPPSVAHSSIIATSSNEQEAIHSMDQRSEAHELLQLRHQYHSSQEEVNRLQREVVMLKEQLEKRDKTIAELNCDNDALSESLAKSKSAGIPDDRELEIESLRDIIDQYKRSVRSLVDEIELKRLHETEYDRRVNVEKQKGYELEREGNLFKAKFVALLSDKFKVVPNPAGGEERKDTEEAVYKEELLWLLQRESEGNDEFHYKSSFKDEYGDWHDWQTDTTVQHYLCRQLYLHYTQYQAEKLVQEWADLLRSVKNVKGTNTLELLPSNDRVKRRELRSLLRRGIPIQYRTRMWSSLVYRLMGRVKEVKDSTAGPGNSYYQSLLNSKNEGPAEKQILLDLHRTLPSNTHFRSNGYGTPKLKNVLVAYSHHNKNVGYCQGMNLLAAVALLFLDEETTFWFLQAVIEKLLPAGYFSPGLLGAQADQAVIRELLPQKLPRLSAHLDLHSIDVTLITFNWFLTLFIDAMPTEAALRILDCFLLEGSKVLFRVGLGVLKVNACHLLSITDPVTLFQTLKEIAKHTFNIEQLFKVAFTGMQPFPNRSTISNRHSYHYGTIKEQWLLREQEVKEREVRSKLNKLKKPPLRSLVLERSFRETQKARRHLMWECGCVRVREGKEEEVWLCCGDRHQGRIAIISNASGQWNMEVPKNDVSSRVISIGYVNSDLMIIGTLDFNLHAIHCSSLNEVWSIKMPDSVLAIQSTDDCTVFAALADGFVAVLQNVTEEAPDGGPLLVHIGSGAVTCLALAADQQLWCGCGIAITILSSQTFEPVDSVAIEELKGKVYKMATSQHGVWVSFRSSSLVSLYEARRRVKLLQLDYTDLLPVDITFSDNLDARITSLTVAGDRLWVGTGSGAVLLFAVSGAVAEAEAVIAKLARDTSNLTVLTDESGDRGQGLVTVLDQQEASEQAERKEHYRNRRTAFGRTLRGPSHSMKKAEKSPAVFKLVFENGYQLPQAESVRVLLSMCQGDATVSCVHAVTDWEKGVQGWTCHATSKKWSFQYLMSPDQFQDTKSRSHSEQTGDDHK